MLVIRSELKVRLRQLILLESMFLSRVFSLLFLFLPEIAISQGEKVTDLLITVVW